jgi:hypothetical protein
LMRFTFVLSTFLTLSLVAACGSDDSDTGSTGTGGSATGGTSSGGIGNGGSAGSGGASGSSVGGNAGAGAQDGGGGSGGGAACLPPDILSVLDEHLGNMFASGSLLATHASAAEATAFFHAPGLAEPPGFTAIYASLFMQCGDPTLFDPYCEEDHCTRIECTGEGAGWVEHAYLDSPPFESGGFTFSAATVDNAWADGATGTTFTIAATATGPGGTDWSMTGSGALELSGVTLEEVFPNLFSQGAATLSYDSNATPKGGLELAGVLIAEIGSDDHLVATGNCPP